MGQHHNAARSYVPDRDTDTYASARPATLRAVGQQHLKAVNLAPIPKKSAGSTGKSGASLSGRTLGGKSGVFGSTGNKLSTFGSTGNKSSNFGSTASKTSTFGSTASKSSVFPSSASKSSSSVAAPRNTSTFGAISPGKDSSSRSPSFLGASGKVSSGLTPSTSKKTYETVSYSPKNAKSSTSFGIIWLPGRKRNKKKDLIYSSMNYDKKNERTPTMYNVMSGDSPDYQLHKKKDEEANLLVPEKMKGPIATAASAGAAATIAEVEAPAGLAVSDPEEKPLIHDEKESKEAAGDSNDKEDSDYLENKDVVNKAPESKQEKSSDKVDSVFISPLSGIKSPSPQSTTSNPEDDECIVKCLYYTIQCCDCVLM